MKSWPVTLLLGILFLVWGVNAPSASAKTAGLCLECHSQRFAFEGSSDFYGAAGIEDRHVYQARLNPCPGVKNLTEETFYTESRLRQLNRMAAEADAEGSAPAVWRRKAAETGESFSRMKLEAGGSVSQFARGAAVLRSDLQKVYDQAFEARAESDRRWLIGVSGILLVLVLVLAGIGSRILGRIGIKILFAALLCGSFSLSACSREAKEATPKSAPQERLDQARTVAAKLTAKVEDRFSESILLAQIARDWARIDGPGGEKAFQLAWRMALKAREEGRQIGPLKKVAEPWPNPVEAARQKVNFDAVLDLRDDLRAIEGRTWALRAIAEEWWQANPKKGREALEFATRAAYGIPNGDVRDIELKALAEAWAAIDETKALETGRAIEDPFLRSVSLAGLALKLKGKERAGELLRESWQLMETISIAPLKIQAFARISAAAAGCIPREKTEWAEKAQSKVKELKDPLLQGFALQELVSAWAPRDWEQAERFAREIPAEQAEVRAFALIRIGMGGNIPRKKAAELLLKAIAEADRIQDGFQAQKAMTQALLRMAVQAPEQAKRYLPRIQDPIPRSEVEACLVETVMTRDLDEALKAAGHIPSEFLRLRAVLKVLNQKLPQDIAKTASLFQEAMKAGANISDPYTRVFFLADLGRSWGRIEKTREAAVYEDALRASKEIFSPSLKAEALEALASAWKISDKERAQTALENVDPTVRRARQAVEEVKLWAKTDLGRANQTAESIPASFLIEKVQAYKELGISVKKMQPKEGLDALQKAWGLAITIPEGGSREKILTQILTETASLNVDKFLVMAQAVSDRELKDRLLWEAGGALLKDESVVSLGGALKIAKEISESTARTAIYQKAAERAVKGPIKGNGTDQAFQASLSQWGRGREAAKREETEAAPFFEEAFREIGKIADSRDRAFLLAALIGDWAQVEEVKALKAAETIPSEMAEALSYSLLQASVHLRKWNRKEAEGAFEKTLKAAEKIPDPSLRGQRMIQIAREWQLVNKEKGKEVLRKAADASGSPYRRAKSLLDWAKLIYKESTEKDLKLLEKALQIAQESKSSGILSEIALAWSWVDAGKTLDIVGQIDSRGARVKALRQTAVKKAKAQPALGASLLEKASREALAIEGLGEEISALRGIAADWAGSDPARAKATYQLIFQIAEKADSTASGFASP
jgi:hypothetical protein